MELGPGEEYHFDEQRGELHCPRLGLVLGPPRHQPGDESGGPGDCSLRPLFAYWHPEGLPASQEALLVRAAAYRLPTVQLELFDRSYHALLPVIAYLEQFDPFLVGWVSGLSEPDLGVLMSLQTSPELAELAKQNPALAMALLAGLGPADHLWSEVARWRHRRLAAWLGFPDSRRLPALLRSHLSPALLTAPELIAVREILQSAGPAAKLLRGLGAPLTPAGLGLLRLAGNSDDMPITFALLREADTAWRKAQSQGLPPPWPHQQLERVLAAPRTWRLRRRYYRLAALDSDDRRFRTFVRLTREDFASTMPHGSDTTKFTQLPAHDPDSLENLTTTCQLLARWVFFLLRTDPSLIMPAMIRDALFGGEMGIEGEPGGHFLRRWLDETTSVDELKRYRLFLSRLMQQLLPGGGG